MALTTNMTIPPLDIDKNYMEYLATCKNYTEWIKSDYAVETDRCIKSTIAQLINLVDVLRSRGVNITIDTPLSQWAAEIAATIPKDSSYIRNAAWLTMPTLSPAENKICILNLVYPNDANEAMIVIGLNDPTKTFTIDWGDGSVETCKEGPNLSWNRHVYNYNALNSKIVDAMYKQAMITVTAVDTSFKTVKLNKPYSDAAPGPIYSHWADIVMAGSNVKELEITSGGDAWTTNAAYLERFQYIGTNLVINYDKMFYNCPMLKEVDMKINSGAPGTTTMYDSCPQLIIKS